MRTFSKVLIQGRLGDVPELKRSSKNDSVFWAFSVACDKEVDSVYPDGRPQKANWFNVLCFNPAIQELGLKKGDPVLIQGTVDVRTRADESYKGKGEDGKLRAVWRDSWTIRATNVRPVVDENHPTVFGQPVRSKGWE
jgi:single-stranded DNA-binding protein